MPINLYQGGENGLWTFLLVTILMGGLAAYASGKAIAQTWRPFWHVPLYMLALAAVVRFCHFALFEEPLLSLRSYAVESKPDSHEVEYMDVSAYETIMQQISPLSALAVEECVGHARQCVKRHRA